MEDSSTHAAPVLRTVDLFSLAKLSEKFFESVPDASRLNVEKIVAFEENPRFVYLAGKTGIWLRRIVLLKPGTFVVEDQMQVPAAGTPASCMLLAQGKPKIDGRRLNMISPEGELSGETLLPKDATFRIACPRPYCGNSTEHVVEIVAKADGQEARFLYMFQVRQPGGESPRPRCELVQDNDGWQLIVSASAQVLKLSLPTDRDAAGTIAIAKAKDQSLLDKRLLPSGIMPHGQKGLKLIERWDSAYHSGRRPSWDKGRPSSELKRLIEKGVLRPGRAVELGCGTGTNAVYLAKHGFDVTAIDIAPTALNRARAKAGKAGVKVHWILADVLAIPELGTFDFIFDRGCYHGVRRTSAARYVETLRRLSRPGTSFLVLAGNANEPPPHYGPPRVKEEQLRDELGPLFEFERLREIRFDPSNPGEKGALAWSALLRRKNEP
jgi:SAM-dependent methyltransferase